MKFQDPMRCRCTSCGAENKLPVRDLMALTAFCPNCGASFRETGMVMRRTTDEVSTYFDAVVIVMQVEQELDVAIPEEMAEATFAKDDVSLHDLATLVNRSNPAVDMPKAEHAVRSAVRAEFPDAPELLDFAAPLLNTIAPNRKYGGQ